MTNSERNESERAHVEELGGVVDGERIALDRRLFMQLLAFGDCDDTDELIRELRSAEIPAVVYHDANDPRGIGLLTAYENPDRFVEELRPFLRESGFGRLRPRPELTMLGRTYAIGYEKDLEYSLLKKPVERMSDEAVRWAIWYPLRRKGEYETLPPERQHDIQVEHMRIGRTFARVADISDVRLACHGLGMEDNDFIVGLLGARLDTLSMIVQNMRKSQQTSRYLEVLGPFFVGRVAGRTVDVGNPLNASVAG